MIDKMQTIFSSYKADWKVCISIECVRGGRGERETGGKYLKFLTLFIPERRSLYYFNFLLIPQ